MKNKSKSHNHPLSRLLLLLVFTLLFIISCKKNEETILKKDTIQEAQEWFRSKTINQNLNTSMFRSKGINKLSTLSPQSFASIPANADHTLNIEWKNAKQYQSNDSTIIEVPVNTKGIFKFNTEPANDKKISINKSFTRVLFIETALKTEGYFMTIISSDTYLAKNGSNPYNNSHLRKESDFEGTIVYHDLSGKMLNAFSISKLKLANKQASINPTPKDKISIAIPDNCVGTPVYEVIGTDCYDIGAYYTYCENVYSIYLGSTGCGSGGGITNPNAPGGGGAGDSGTTSMTMPPPPAIPITDIKKFLSCFDKSKSASLTVYAEKIATSFPGHAFISIKQGSNTMVLGFYPKESFPSTVSGPGVMGENGEHAYNAATNYGDISSEKLQKIIDTAIKFSSSNYILTNNNCANFALEVLRILGVTDITGICTPDNIYDLIKPYATSTNGKAPKTQRTCD
ncbi:hypothetical protein J7E50_01315 [Pedobacter sp. ISL-68]|uniref:hypothetical protein n=1 Tax=unclassified Pedobacter TaxID=2628915 RepID=UPI001BE54188|nr:MULTISPECIES: hypothetical protein [unclassified Pedobacter]MBT2563405.1 hypothetical protein [Pedobacter sp. ISL-64]MBT2588840.1 hypothetical protein [Pedobacter sp. ISL-68]